MWLEVLRRALLYTITNYLTPFMYVIAILAFAYVVEKLFLLKRIAGYASEKAAKVDELHGLLEAERAKYLKLEATVKAGEKSEGLLTDDYNQIITCIHGAGEMTAKQLCRETGDTPGAMTGRLRTLRLSLQLIYRVGMRGEQEVYGITDKGREYANRHGIQPVPQSFQELEQSEQAKQIAELRNELSSTVEREKLLRAEVNRLRAGGGPQQSLPSLIGIVGSSGRAFDFAPSDVVQSPERNAQS